MNLPPALSLLVAAVLAIRTVAAPGDLDAGFGSGGKVVTSLGIQDAGASVALQNDGKIVVAGYSYAGFTGTADFALVRYTSTGALDPSFGNGGKVSTDIGGDDDLAFGVAVQNDGKIVAVGASSNGGFYNRDFALARYHADGTLDSGFGNGGKVKTPVGTGHNEAQYVVLQSDGKIVVAGYGSNGFAVVRYDSEGSLDLSFGSGGIVITPIGSGGSLAFGAALQSDGKIVVAGYAEAGAANDFAIVVARYTSTGALDAGFGSSGTVITNLSSGMDFGWGVVVQSDGKIIVGGDSDGDFALVRYTSIGVLDSSFGSGGVVTTDVGNNDNGVSLALQSDGKIVLAGYTVGGLAAVRYTSGGVLDNSFGSGGMAGNSGVDAGASVALQGDGKIVVAGDSNGDFALVRYQGDMVPDTLRHSIPGMALGEHFADSVAISGTLMVVGAPYEDTGASNAGSVYVYDLGSGTPTVPVAVLNNPSPVASDHFGVAVAISGTRVVVGAEGDDSGASNAGSAYVYDMSSVTPTVPLITLDNPDPRNSDYFGHSVAISGTRVVVGVPYRTPGGIAYVYDLSSGTPTVPVTTLVKGGPAEADDFGWSVGISGTRVVVGADRTSTGASAAGSAFVYDLTSATPTAPVATLNNPSPENFDSFGYSVGISGTRVVVGAIFDNTGAPAAGNAYVYELTSGTPTVPVATLNNPSPQNFDHFGWSVAISGTRVVVGALGDDTGASDAGSAYVYDLSNGTPTAPVATLNNPALVNGYDFGTSVAIDGTTVVVGAFGGDVIPELGAAYVFAPADTDYDGDGLLDLWEYARFGTTAGHTALGDSDGDGRKELLEQAFDTDPLFSDPVAAPMVVDEGGFLTITLSKRAGVSYAVESAGSPDDAAFSLGTTTIITNNASTLKVRDNFTPATAAQRYMRVKVQSAP